jgi:GNAT superfamily N-acetyltransferase
VAHAVREARPGEEEALVAMYEWLFAPPGSKPEGWDPERARERLGEAITSPRSTILVAEEDGALIGLCSAYLDIDSVRFGPRCWVEDLAVDPERRSEGVGAALLDAAREWARAAGASHLELDSGLARADAHRFYEREGGTRQSYSFNWELRSPSG